jgi:hypothetical protein
MGIITNIIAAAETMWQLQWNEFCYEIILSGSEP